MSKKLNLSSLRSKLNGSIILITISTNPKIKEKIQEYRTIFLKLSNLLKDFNEVLFLTDIEIRVNNPIKITQQDEKKDITTQI